MSLAICAFQACANKPVVLGQPIRGDQMPGAYPSDLRERVVGSVTAGTSRRSASVAFKVSASSALRWTQRFRETGGWQAKPAGGDRRWRREMDRGKVGHAGPSQSVIAPFFSLRPERMPGCSDASDDKHGTGKDEHLTITLSRPGHHRHRHLKGSSRCPCSSRRRRPAVPQQSRRARRADRLDHPKTAGPHPLRGDRRLPSGLATGTGQGCLARRQDQPLAGPPFRRGQRQAGQDRHRRCRAPGIAGNALRSPASAPRRSPTSGPPRIPPSTAWLNCSPPAAPW